MADIAFSVKSKEGTKTKFLVEIDADKFESLAANFGFFNQDFLESLNNSENDYKLGRIKKIKSLKDLRK